MASPFAVFRRHRKAFIAGLTILTMFGFVFIPMILENMGIRTAKDPVVVRTEKFGKLTAREVGFMQQQRERVLSILQEAGLMASGGNPEVARRVREQLQQVFGTGTEQSVVEGWLLAREAEQLGLTVNKQAINGFLRSFTSDRLDARTWKGLYARHGMSERQFFHAFRQELLAMRFRQMFQYGQSVLATPPGQRWDYLTRLMRQATIEVLDVSVSKYVAVVPDPDEETVKKFFAEHKDNLVLPDSPAPGFREPHKIEVQYFEANSRVFAAAAVKDDEIKQHYEKNKEKYDRLDAEVNKKAEGERPSAEKPKKEEPEKEKPSTGKPSSEKPSTEKPSTEKPEKEEPATEKEGEKAKTKEPDSEKPEVTKPEVTKPDTEKSGAKEGEPKKPETEKPEATKPESGKPETEVKQPPDDGAPAKSPESGDASSAGASSAFRLAAFLQQPSGDATAGEKAKSGEQEPAKSKGTAKSKRATKSKKTPTSKEAPKTAEKPAEKVEKPAEKEEMPVPQPPESAEKPDETAKPPEGKSPKVEEEPLDRSKLPVPETPKSTAATAKEYPSAWIKNRIRDELAEKKRTVAFDRLQEIMNDYHTRWRNYKAKLVDNPDAQPPKPLSFAALARQYHLTSGETGLISKYQLEDQDIAKSATRDGQPFAEFAFQTSRLPLYKPETTESGDFIRGNSYFLFWKVEDRLETAPKLEDEGVYQEAEQKWKEVQARRLAKEAAEELAAEARATKRSLRATFPKQGVVEAGPFSWMTTGTLPFMMSQEPATMSKVQGVDRPGDAFMRTVFDLAPGEIGVAMNQPETEAYVIRMREVKPPDESLWASFESYPFRMYARVAVGEQEQMSRAWLEEIKASAGLKWVDHLPDRQAETQAEN